MASDLEWFIDQTRSEVRDEPDPTDVLGDDFSFSEQIEENARHAGWIPGEEAPAVHELATVHTVSTARLLEHARKAANRHDFEAALAVANAVAETCTGDVKRRVETWAVAVTMCSKVPDSDQSWWLETSTWGDLMEVL